MEPSGTHLPSTPALFSGREFLCDPPRLRPIKPVLGPKCTADLSCASRSGSWEGEKEDQETHFSSGETCCLWFLLDLWGDAPRYPHSTEAGERYTGTLKLSPKIHGEQSLALRGLTAEAVP